MVGRIVQYHSAGPVLQYRNGCRDTLRVLSLPGGLHSPPGVASLVIGVGNGVAVGGDVVNGEGAIQSQRTAGQGEGGRCSVRSREGQLYRGGVCTGGWILIDIGDVEHIIPRLSRAEIPVQIGIAIEGRIRGRLALQYGAVRRGNGDRQLRSSVVAPDPFGQGGRGLEWAGVQRVDGDHQLPIFKPGHRQQAAVGLSHRVESGLLQGSFLRGHQGDRQVGTIQGQNQLQGGGGGLRQISLIDQPQGVSSENVQPVLADGDGLEVIQAAERDIQRREVGTGLAVQAQIGQKGAVLPIGVLQMDLVQLTLNNSALLQNVGAGLRIGVHAVAGHEAEVAQDHVGAGGQRGQDEGHQQPQGQRPQQLFQTALLPLFHRLIGQAQGGGDLTGRQSAVIFQANDLLVYRVQRRQGPLQFILLFQMGEGVRWFLRLW